MFLVSIDGSGRIKIADAGNWKMNWSANGDYLAYIAFFNDASWVCRLTIADRTELCIPDTYNNLRDIALSPDGSKMILRGDFNLVIWDLTENTVNQTTEKGYDPSWSPDGKWIAFAGGELNDLFIMRIDGSEEYLLVDQVSYDFAWRP